MFQMHSLLFSLFNQMRVEMTIATNSKDCSKEGPLAIMSPLQLIGWSGQMTNWLDVGLVASM